MDADPPGIAVPAARVIYMVVVRIRGGYYGSYMWAARSCPPGYWRGPWGHCRDTPYHGPLPGGGWK